MTHRSFYFIIFCSFILLPASYAKERVIQFQSQGMKLQAKRIVSGLGIPWGITFITKDKILVTERGGKARLLNLESRQLTEVTGLPEMLVDGQGGLLDVKIAPDYQHTGWIYFTYVKNVDDEGATTLARAKLNNNALIDWQDIVISQSTNGNDYHFGSRIAFDHQGHVYFGIGDRGERPNSQDLTNHAGCVLRITLDGKVPQNNPFIKHKKALPEIWSYGHRNPQGLVYDKLTDRLWLIEHGPRGGDEINLVKPGANYGWPVISYGKEYWGPVDVGEGTHRKGMEQPVKVYIPSIAPGSLMLYSGNQFLKWKGSLFSGSLKLRHINRVEIDEEGKAINEERLLTKLDERIRSIIQGPDELIYFSTDAGHIYKIDIVK